MKVPVMGLSVPKAHFARHAATVDIIGDITQNKALNLVESVRKANSIHGKTIVTVPFVTAVFLGTCERYR